MVKTVLDRATQRLSVAGCDSPRLDAEVLLAHALNKDRTWLYTHPEAVPAKEQWATFAALLRRREQREPVAYITGHKEFYGLDFWVTPHVLIPRPETELLVETAIQLATGVAQLAIADIGTGSGCIAVALAKHISGATLLAVDVSAKALQVAQHNASQNDIGEKITFLQGSLLTPLPQPVDMIVSNPPYVSGPELAMVMPEVKQYEPVLALDGGEDGLNIIEKLLAQAEKKLNPGGCLLVEIGSSQGEAVTKLGRKYFPHRQVEIKQDLAGLDRLLVIQPENV